MKKETKLKLTAMALSVTPSFILPTLAFQWVVELWGYDLTNSDTAFAVFASVIAGLIIAAVACTIIEENWKK